MEKGKPSIISASTLLSLQQKQISFSPQQPPINQDTLRKIQKLRQLELLLQQANKEHLLLNQQHLWLEQQLSYKKQLIQSQIEEQQEEELNEFDFQQQTSRLKFGHKQEDQHKGFIRSKKHQFYSAFTSPRQHSPELIRNKQKSFIPYQVIPRTSLIRKQSQQSYRQFHLKRTPFMKERGYFRKSASNYRSIDELWEECEVRRYRHGVVQ